MSGEEKTREQRLAEHQAKQAARAEEKRKRQELVEDLEMRFDEELGGARGREFEIVETEDGPIVVVLGPEVLFKKFSDSKKTQVDVENFVRPLVKYPDGATYAGMVAKRSAYAIRCANALCTLYGVKSEDESGKY